MRLIIALLLALGLFISSAVANDPWILVGKTERSTFYMYRGSLGIDVSGDGKRIFYVAGKYETAATKETVLQIWYVPVEDCIRNRGKLFVLDKNARPVTDIDFKQGDDSVGASLARIICNAALNLTNDSKNRI